MWVVVYKETGNTVWNKIYKSEKIAQRYINSSRASDKDEFVAVELKAFALKTMANGGWMSAMVNGGRLPVPKWERD